MLVLLSMWCFDLDLHGDTVTNTDVCDLKGKRLRASFQPCP